jgi:hypothetical protein
MGADAFPNPSIIGASAEGNWLSLRGAGTVNNFGTISATVGVFFAANGSATNSA